MSNTELEIWKNIENYPDYMVSNLGRIKSFKYVREKILKNRIDNKGYYRVELSMYGNNKTFKVHRLVYFTFNPNADKSLEINHINEDKGDNRLENLEICTHQYNNAYGTKNQRANKTKRRKRIIKHYILQQIKYINELKAYKKRLKQLIK